MINIGRRLEIARERAKFSQNQLVDQLNISIRTYRNYIKDSTNISVKLVNEVAQICNVNPLWILGYTTIPTRDQATLDNIFGPYFDVLRTVCPQDQIEAVENQTIEEIIRAVSTQISKYLVNSLLIKMTDLPLFDKIKKFIIFTTDLGATIRIWSVIEQASINLENISAKEKLVKAAQSGLSLNKWLISQAERDFIAHFVDTWPDDVCVFLLQHSGSIIEALKNLSPATEKAISSNTKTLNFIRRFRTQEN